MALEANVLSSTYNSHLQVNHHYNPLLISTAREICKAWYRAAQGCVVVRPSRHRQDAVRASSRQ